MKMKNTALHVKMQLIKYKTKLMNKSILENKQFIVRMGITKCRMLTGTYLLQSNKHKFSKSNERATCKCCGLGDKDVIHMLLECPALYVQRKQYFSNVKSMVSDCIGLGQWEETFNNKTNLVQLILDSSKLPIFHNKPEFLKIVRATTELCHNLHVARLHKLNA